MRKDGAKLCLDDGMLAPTEMERLHGARMRHTASLVLPEDTEDCVRYEHLVRVSCVGAADPAF